MWLIHSLYNMFIFTCGIFPFPYSFTFDEAFCFPFIEVANNNDYLILSTYSTVKHFVDITSFIPHLSTETRILSWVAAEGPVMKMMAEDKGDSEEHNWRE